MSGLTSLPQAPAPAPPAAPPNPARDVQQFVGGVMQTVMAPIDNLNLALAKLTYAFVQMLPKFPAARLFGDLVFGWPHAHLHPPNLIPPAPPIPLPSIGPVICAGAVNVLINGLPSARCGDVGFGVWCGGFFPLFEVQTGSSHVFIGGSRPARQLIDLTLHCQKGDPGLGAMGKAMMAFTAVMGAIGVAAELIDMENAEMAANEAQTEAEAAAASASAAASALGAVMTAAQTAADIAAAALQAGMGTDPWAPPGVPLGNFLTGSPNVVIGGFPMPGWMLILKGLGKLLKGLAKRLQLRFRPGSLPSRLLCFVTGHPVDVSSGRVLTSQTDFKLPGLIPLDFERMYDSSSDYNGPIGYGWMHPFDVHLYEDYAERMTVYREAEGRLIPFKLLKVGERDYNPREKLWLERKAEDYFIITTQTRARYVFEKHKLSSNGHDAQATWQLSFIEDLCGNRITCSYSENRLHELTDTIGRVFRFTYTPQSKIAEIRLARFREDKIDSLLMSYEYDAQGNLIAARDPAGHAYRFEYQNHALVKETNRNGLSFYFEYDEPGAGGRCIHTWGDGQIHERWIIYNDVTRTTMVRDSRGGINTYHMNEAGLVDAVIDSSGGKLTFEWDENNNRVAETDALGNTTRWEFDEQGNCIAKTNAVGGQFERTFNELNLITSHTDAAGNSKRYTYDQRGNLLTLTNGVGATWLYEYDGQGFLRALIEPNGHRLEQQRADDWSWIEFRDELGLIDRLAYDVMGHQTAHVDGEGARQEFRFDARGLRTEIVYPDRSSELFEYDPETNVTAFTSRTGQRTEYSYGGYNKLVRKRDPSGRVTEYKYDPADEQLVEIVNEKGEVARLERNPTGRVIRSRFFDGRIEEYTHDAVGHVVQVRQNSGRVTMLEFDGMDRVIGVHSADDDLEYTYDPAGRLVQAKTRTSTVEVEYDAEWHPLKVSQNGQVIEYKYDQVGRRIERDNKISGRRVGYNYDRRSRLIRLEDETGVLETYSYNNLNKVTERNLRGDVTERNVYDPLGKLTRQSIVAKGGVSIADRRYSYSGAGLVARVIDARHGSTDYNYSPTDQLLRAVSSRGRVENYSYDPADNMIVSAEVGQLRYGAGNRLLQDSMRLYEYDADGQLTAVTRQGQRTEYSYDSVGRLARVKKPDGATYTYSYDALGRRVSKRNGGSETKFYWDGHVPLCEGRNGSLDVEYLFYPDTFNPCAQWVRGKLYSYLLDVVDLPRELVDEGGSVVWQGEYTSYGRLVSASGGGIPVPFRLLGQTCDDETGLHYNRYRYYDPLIGRYITPDPMGILADLNEYAYPNNPLTLADPFGLIPRPHPGPNQTINETGPGGDYAYQTDSQGRVIQGDGPLARPSSVTPERNTYLQGDTPGRMTGVDDGGHIFGSQFGGPAGTRANYFSQNWRTNEYGAWHQFEGSIAAHLEANPHLRAEGRVTLDYHGTDTRPHRVRVEVTFYDAHGNAVKTRGRTFTNPVARDRSPKRTC